MPADRPINLNTARKTRAKAEKRREAESNAAKYGRTKAQRELEAAEARKMREALDAHRRKE